MLMVGENQYESILESVVGDARKVDSLRLKLKELSKNAPSFDPDRRKFLKCASLLMGYAALGNVQVGCATTNTMEQVSWQEFLLSKDLIRGPDLFLHPLTRQPSTFEHNKDRFEGLGSINYEVPIGTPIVPVTDAVGKWYNDANSEVTLNNLLGFRSAYRMFQSVSDKVKKKRDLSRLTDSERIELFTAGVPDYKHDDILGYSGESGPPGYARPNINVIIFRANASGFIHKPGLDPLKLGIDQKSPVGNNDKYGLPYGGRPVYWDGKTEIDASKRVILRQKTLDTLTDRLKSGELDKGTVDEINKLSSDPIAVRDYLGKRVLVKKPSAEGPKYEFMPGSFMYQLMLEFYSRMESHNFIAMLPFIFPLSPVREAYEKANSVLKNEK